jgi:hypothetical protein
MSLSMYQASVTVFTRSLTALSAILDKAAADAETRGIDPSIFVNARLAPDMFALARQVQIAADTARNGAALLAGVEAPSHPDTETTFPELKARIATVLDYLKTFKPEQFEGADTRTVVLKMRAGDMTFAGADYLLGFALPNLFFHAATAYDILRANGVAVGKRDFLGGL